MEAPAAGGAGVDLRIDLCPGLVSVKTSQVSAERVTIHGGVLAQVAAVDFLARLAQHVYAQLALAGEVVLADWALEARLGEMEAEVLQEVGAHLEAAAALRAHVGAIDVLCALMDAIFGGY